MRRFFTAGIALCVLVATAALVTSFATAARRPSGRLAIFDRAATSRDRVPKAIMKTNFADLFTQPVAARFVGVSTAGFAFYAVKGRDDHVCLVGTKGAGKQAETYGICRERAALKTDAIWVGRGRDPHGSDIAGLASNGYRRLEVEGRSVAIHGNTFFARISGETASAKLTGPGLKAAQVAFSAG